MRLNLILFLPVNYTMNNTNQNIIALKALSRASYRGVSVDMLRNRGLSSPTGVICHLRNAGWSISTIKARRANAKTRYVFTDLARPL